MNEIAKRNAVFVFSADDAQLEAALERNIKKSRDLQDVFEDSAKTMQKLGRESEKSLKIANTETQKTSKTSKEYRKDLKEMVFGFSVLGFSIGAVSKKFKEFREILTTARKAIVGTTDVTDNQKRSAADLSRILGGGEKGFLALAKGANVLRVALLSTGIGALITAFGALGSFLTSTQDGIDFVGRKTSFLKGIFAGAQDQVNQFGRDLFETFQDEGIVAGIEKIGDSLVAGIGNRINALGEAFTQLFTGNFAEALNAGSRVITGLSKEQQDQILETAKAYEVLEGRRQALIIQDRDIAIQTAASRAQIKQLNKDAEDTTLSFNRRIEAAKETVAIEQNLLSLRIKSAQERLDIIRAQNALTESTNEEIQKEADAEIALQNLRTESFELQTTQTNKVNILIKQQQDLIDGVRESYKDLNDEISLQVDDSLIRLQEERRIALENLEERRQDVISRAVLSEKATPEEIQAINSKFDELTAITGDAFDKQIRELRERFGTVDFLPTIESLDRVPELTIAGERVQEIADRIKFLNEQLENSPQSAEGITNITDEIKKLREEAKLLAETPPTNGDFGKEFCEEVDEVKTKQEEAIEAGKKLVEELAKNLKDSASNLLQFEVDQVDRSIEAQERRVEKAAELAEKGRDDILSAETEKLDKLKEERERFVEAQLALDKLEIASSNLKQIANAKEAISNAAKVPFPLNLAAVPLTLALLATNIASAVSVVSSFKDGVDFLEGPGTTTSDSIPARLSKGEGVVKASTNAKRLKVGLNNENLDALSSQMLKMGYTAADLEKLASMTPVAHHATDLSGGVREAINNRSLQEQNTTLKLMRQEMHGLRRDLNTTLRQRNPDLNMDGRKVGEAVRRNNRNLERHRRLN